MVSYFQKNVVSAKSIVLWYAVMLWTQKVSFSAEHNNDDKVQDEPFNPCMILDYIATKGNVDTLN